MGCGNNKVSRDYLTSQPVTTPSPRAAKATAANLGNQVLRVISQVSQENADRVAQARAAAAREAKATQVVEAKREAERKAAAEKSKAKKAKDEAREQRELEDAQRLLAVAAYHANAERLPTRLGDAGAKIERLPGQPEKTEILINGQPKEIDSFARKITSTKKGLVVEELVDADAAPVDSPLHVHVKAKADGTWFMQATDRRDGQVWHSGGIEIMVPDAPDDLIDAAFDVVSEMLRERG